MLVRGLALKLLRTSMLDRRIFYCPRSQVSALLQTKRHNCSKSPISSEEEILQNIKKQDTTNNSTADVNDSINKSAVNKAEDEPHLTISMPTVTKKLEINTSKGILSVTTTIEDSKINDVILEKTSSVAQANTNKTAKVETKKADVVKESAQNLKKSATESVKKVVAKLISPAVPSEPTIKKDKEIDEQPHVLEMKVKKKPVKATVKAIEKLATAAVAAATAQTKVDTAIPAKAIPTKPIKPRVLIDLNRSSLERNFITPGRAMSDFLLKAADLENLPKIKRRSPYEQEPPMTVFWRRDVEAKAIEIWGSRENLLKEQLKRDVERKKHQQSI